MKEKPINFLKHLQLLTGNFNNKKIFYIKIYSQKKLGKYIPIRAYNEGVACVDDTARAIILALEIYDFYREEKALTQAQKWLTFLEYMQDNEGFITNFIDSPKGKRKFDIPSSYKGGVWWSARAKWSWAKAYKVTKDKKYLDLYVRTKISDNYQNDVASILLLAGLEIFEEEDKSYLKYLLERITSCRSKEGYFLHAKGELLHMWGYHQLEAVAKAAIYFKDKKKLISYCQDTADTLVKNVINNNFYFEYLLKNKKEISPYCISPLVRGLYELYFINKNEKYFDLLKKCLNWFKPLYDPETGRCFDWIQGNKIASDCGAEASIEAGFCYLRKLKLKL